MWRVTAGRRWASRSPRWPPPEQKSTMRSPGPASWVRGTARLESCPHFLSSLSWGSDPASGWTLEGSEDQSRLGQSASSTCWLLVRPLSSHQDNNYNNNYNNNNNNNIIETRSVFPSIKNIFENEKVGSE